MASRGPFWPRFWRAFTHQGPPWQPDLNALRVQHFNEAATAAEALIPALQREYPEEPSNSPWCCGVKDAAAEIRRIAALPTA